jgi:hypothetical protein
LSDRRQLEAHLPECFRVGAEPIVTVYASYMTEIEWLAGRGYNVLGVQFPAIYEGKKDHVSGSFLAVLWENLTDPIITGREELGYAKIYCELPQPAVFQGGWHCTASWLGFLFLDLRVENVTQQSPPEIEALGQEPAGDGVLHYKYMPRTGEWGTADLAYATLTPAGSSHRTVKERWVGEGSVQFHRAAWKDMPTQFNIVNALSDLEIKEYRGATVTRTTGGSDLSGQRILR